MKNKTPQRILFNCALSFFILTFAFFVFAVKTTNAASLYFSPSSGNFSVGDIISTSVFVNTEGVAINNSDAVISFPSALLEVVSLNKSSSIFSLWVEEPAFSNSAGTISYNGGLPTPGFNGSAGKVLNIVFRVRNIGSSSVVFSSSAVRANDGYGTDVLTARKQAQFSLISAERPVVPPPKTTLNVPQAPQISSPTHPDPEKWYSKDIATFTWPLGTGVTATRLLVGKIPVAEPVVLYAPAIDQKIIEDLDDGILYFHAQLKNNAGWGEATHFRFQIDTENPDRFEIQLVPKEDAADPQVEFRFDANDKTSGIDHYEIQIDGQSAGKWNDDGTHIYKTPILERGNHVLVVKAVDKAGNSLQNSMEFGVTALESPTITEYPKELQGGEILIIRGETYSDSKVTVLMQREKDTPVSFIVQSDTNGIFNLETDAKLKNGVYNAWTEVLDARGAKSGPSEKVIITVKAGVFPEIGSTLINLLSMAIVVVALITLLLFIPWFTYHKSSHFRRRIQKEIREAESTTHKAFDLLREDVQDQIKLLEKTRTKRQLTKEEERIIRRLKKNLTAAEKLIKKKIENIEKRQNNRPE